MSTRLDFFLMGLLQLFPELLTLHPCPLVGHHEALGVSSDMHVILMSG